MVTYSKTVDIFEKIVNGNKLLQGLVNCHTESSREESQKDPPADVLKSNFVSTQTQPKHTNDSSSLSLLVEQVPCTLPVETNQLQHSQNATVQEQYPNSVDNQNLNDIFRNRSSYCSEKLGEMNYDENAGSTACTYVYKILISKLKTDIEATYGPFTIGELDSKTGKLTNVARIYKSIKQQFELLTKIGRNSDNI